MEKEQREIELKKLEIERLKVREGFIRTLAIILLTIGAGIGTGLRIINVPKGWYIGIVSLLGIAFLIIGVIFIFEIINFKRKIKEFEKWKQ